MDNPVVIQSILAFLCWLGAVAFVIIAWLASRAGVVAFRHMLDYARHIQWIERMGKDA